MTNLTVCSAPQQKAAVISFINDAMDDPEIMELLKGLDDKKRFLYTKTLNNVSAYTLDNIIHVRLRDIIVLLNIPFGNASQRVEKMTEGEDFCHAEFRGSDELFLTQSGIISLVFKSRTNIAKTFKKLFTKMIIEVCQNKQMAGEIVKRAVDEDPEMMLDFIQDVGKRCDLLRDMYEQEKNSRICAQNELDSVGKALNNEITVNNQLIDKIALLNEGINYVKNQFIPDDESFVNKLMKYHMVPIYVYILTTDQIARVGFRPENIRENAYSDVMDFCIKNSTILDNFELGFKVVTGKPATDGYVGKFYMHNTKQFATVKELATDEFRFIKKNTSAIYVYGYGSQLTAILQSMASIFPDSA